MKEIVALAKSVLDKSLEKGDKTHKTELFILSLKSLMPIENHVKVSIDYERYNREFNLWKYYRETSNPTLDNILFQRREDIYWEEKDDSLFYRLMPLVLTNSNFDYLFEEVIKNIAYTTGNFSSIIEYLLIAELYYMLINKYENIIEGLKDRVIALNQVEFFSDYGSYFRFPVENNKKYKIDFEMAKIEALNLLNIGSGSNMIELEGYLKIYKENMELPREKILESLLGLEDRYKKYDEYFYSLGEYLYKLRKSRIDPNKLRIKEYNCPDIFEYEVGEWFDHSLLNRSQVVEKVIKGRFICIRLRTKSGFYNFKKPIVR